MSAKRWTVMFSIIVILVLVIYALINFFVDPFGIYGDRIFDWYSFNETINPRIAKIEWLDENYTNYDSYIIGCSSSAAYPVNLLNEYTGDKWYNLFVYGCDMYDSYYMTKYVVNNYKPKNIIINLGLTEATKYQVDDDNENNVLHAKVEDKNIALFYTKYLFKNWRLSYDKITSHFQDTFLPQTFDVFDVDTGMYDKRTRDVEDIDNINKYLENNESFTTDYFEPKECSEIEKCVIAIKDIKNLCDENGVSVTFVLPPIYYKQYEAFSSEDIEKYYIAIAEAADFWDFSLTELSYEPRYFYDTVHIRNSTGEMMISKMYDDTNRYYPDSFGKLVTKENVKEYVSNIKRENDANVLTYTVNVPILLYHEITDTKTSDSTITTKAFEEHLKTLKKNGYTAVSIKQMKDYVEKGVELPEKPVCITFDDGYLSNYEIAYPLLKKYNMKATIFVIGSSVGASGNYKNTNNQITPHFTYTQAMEMISSGIIEIQSHTYDMHRYLPYETDKNVRGSISKLENESDEDFVNEIKSDNEEMNKQFNEKLHTSIYALSYPNGIFDTLTETTLRTQGIKMTFTSQEGNNTLVKGLHQTLFNLNRYNVNNDVSNERLLEILK